MTKGIVLTEAGLEKLKKELEYLKKEKRVEVAERIRLAKDFGDLSENAEYHEAKEEQAFVEGRIVEIENTLKLAHLAEKNGDAGIGVGSTVTVSREGTVIVFEIVGSTESDPSKGKISLDSPLGQALLGKKQGDAVEITTPAGTIRYEIDFIH